MTDKELLELAARAAGMQIGWSIKRTLVGQPDMYGVRNYSEEYCPIIAGVFWNPLTDDGDALRLAVKMRLDILATPDDKVEVTNQFECDEDVRWAWESYGDGAYAATRRAIVRAAAEIGKDMK